MTYRVLKRIKGNAYLYEQESFRICGRVHTRCRSLGAVGGTAGGNPGRPGGISGSAPETPEPEELTLHSKLHISETALRKEHELAITRLRKIGIDPAGFPEIVIRYGSSCTGRPPLG